MTIQFRRSNFIAIIVLAALLVIFLPLFVKDGQMGILAAFTIPPLPPVPSPELLPMRSSKHTMKNLLSLPLTPAKAWVIELPDIKKRGDAEVLVKTLQTKGFKAFSRQFDSLTGVLTRVFVGPEIKPEQMKLVADRINTEMHLETKVVPFDPLLIK